MTAHCPNCGAAIELKLRVARETQRRDETDRQRAVAELVIAALAAHGPMSANDVERKVRRRRADVRAALRALEREGRITLQDPTAARLWAVRPVPVARNGAVSAPEELPLATPEEEERATRLLSTHERWLG